MRRIAFLTAAALTLLTAAYATSAQTPSKPTTKPTTKPATKPVTKPTSRPAPKTPAKLPRDTPNNAYIAYYAAMAAGDRATMVDSYRVSPPTAPIDNADQVSVRDATITHELAVAKLRLAVTRKFKAEVGNSTAEAFGSIPNLDLGEPEFMQANTQAYVKSKDGERLTRMMLDTDGLWRIDYQNLFKGKRDSIASRCQSLERHTFLANEILKEIPKMKKPEEITRWIAQNGS